MGVTSSDTDHCPAETHGYVAACRTCKWTGGGPGPICIAKRQEWIKAQQADKDDETDSQ